MEQVDRPAVRLGDRAVPLVRLAAVGVEIDVIEVVRGHHISQARVVAHVGDNEILTVIGALGDTAASRCQGQWAHPTRRAAAGRLPARGRAARPRGTRSWTASTSGSPPAVRSTTSRDRRATGNVGVWVRLPERARDVGRRARDPRRLRAVRASARRSAARAGGNSLDNTLRVAHRVPDRVGAADIRVHAVADGFGHGLVHLWAEDGTLLGTASQSTIVRSLATTRDSRDAAERRGPRSAG